MAAADDLEEGRQMLKLGSQSSGGEMDAEADAESEMAHEDTAEEQEGARFQADEEGDDCTESDIIQRPDAGIVDAGNVDTESDSGEEAGDHAAVVRERLDGEDAGEREVDTEEHSGDEQVSGNPYQPANIAEGGDAVADTGMGGRIEVSSEGTSQDTQGEGKPQRATDDNEGVIVADEAEAISLVVLVCVLCFLLLLLAVASATTSAGCSYSCV